MTTHEWFTDGDLDTQEWTPATVAPDHGRRIRKRQLVRRLPQGVHDAGVMLTTLTFWRSVTPIAAAILCWVGLWPWAIVVMLAGILAQLMIMERLLMERGE
jgi:hypothetical protein